MRKHPRAFVGVLDSVSALFIIYMEEKRMKMLSDALRLAAFNVSIFNFPDKLNKTEHRIPANTAANIDSFSIGSYVFVTAFSAIWARIASNSNPFNFKLGQQHLNNVRFKFPMVSHRIEFRSYNIF